MTHLANIIYWAGTKLRPAPLINIEILEYATNMILRTGWVTKREYRLKGPCVVLSFLLLLFFVLCGVIV